MISVNNSCEILNGFIMIVYNRHMCSSRQIYIKFGIFQTDMGKVHYTFENMSYTTKSLKQARRLTYYSESGKYRRDGRIILLTKIPRNGKAYPFGYVIVNTNLEMFGHRYFWIRKGEISNKFIGYSLKSTGQIRKKLTLQDTMALVHYFDLKLDLKKE